MARVVEVPLPPLEPRRVFAREARYPWAEWLDGRTWEVVEGEDFTVYRKDFISMAHAAARHRHGRVRTLSKGKAVLLRFFPEAS